VMREKNIMLLHYITGILILVAGGIHLSTVFLLSPYEESMKFDSSPSPSCQSTETSCLREAWRRFSYWLLSTASTASASYCKSSIKAKPTKKPSA
jgi:hypothetical protein